MIGLSHAEESMVIR